MLEGHQVQITLRDTDETRLLARLEALLKPYSVDGNLSCQNGPLGERSYPAKWGPMLYRSHKHHKINGSALGNILPYSVNATWH